MQPHCWTHSAKRPPLANCPKLAYFNKEVKKGCAAFKNQTGREWCRAEYNEHAAAVLDQWAMMSDYARNVHIADWEAARKQGPGAQAARNAVRNNHRGPGGFLSVLLAPDPASAFLSQLSLMKLRIIT